jgi:hypothetical protein
MIPEAGKLAWRGNLILFSAADVRGSNPVRERVFVFQYPLIERVIAQGLSV